MGEGAREGQREWEDREKSQGPNQTKNSPDFIVMRGAGRGGRQREDSSSFGQIRRKFSGYLADFRISGFSLRTGY